MDAIFTIADATAEKQASEASNASYIYMYPKYVICRYIDAFTMFSVTFENYASKASYT